MDTHSEKSIQMYSTALRALVELRQQILSERAGNWPPRRRRSSGP
ncbi:hypothetical protein [Streptomyces sp. NPDC006274]